MKIAVVGDGLSAKATRTNIASLLAETGNTAELEVTTIAPNYDLSQQPIFDRKDSGPLSDRLTLNSPLSISGFPEMRGADSFCSWAPSNGIPLNDRNCYLERGLVGDWISEQEKQAWAALEGVPQQRIFAKAERLLPKESGFELVLDNGDAKTFDQVVLAFGHVFSTRFPALMDDARLILGVPNINRLEELRPVVQSAESIVIAGGRSSTVDTVSLLEAVGFKGVYHIVAPNGPLLDWQRAGCPKVDETTKGRWVLFELLENNRARLYEGKLVAGDVVSDEGKICCSLNGALKHADLFCDCTGPYDSLLVDYGEPELVCAEKPSKHYPNSLACSLIEDAKVPISPKGKLIVDEAGRLNRRNLFAVGPVVQRSEQFLMPQAGAAAHATAAAVVANIQKLNR